MDTRRKNRGCPGENSKIPRIPLQPALALLLLLFGLAACGTGMQKGRQAIDPVTEDGGQPMYGDGGTSQPGDGGTSQPGDGGAMNQPVALCPADFSADIASTIFLDGRGSHDPEGGILTYQWSLEEWPNGSESLLENAQEARAAFYLDRRSDPEKPYRFKLCVTDDEGLSQCCTTRVHTLPNQGLLVRLRWEGEADLDLHLLDDPESTSCGFFSGDRDCYHGNSSPNWGASGSRDDPRYGSNQIGPGPEEIKISAPRAGPVVAAVHLNSGNLAGPFEANLKIYCHNILIKEQAHTFTEPGTFWEAARITLPDCRVAIIDRLYPHSEICR